MTGSEAQDDPHGEISPRRIWQGQPQSPPPKTPQCGLSPQEAPFHPLRRRGSELLILHRGIHIKRRGPLRVHYHRCLWPPEPVLMILLVPLAPAMPRHQSPRSRDTNPLKTPPRQWAQQQQRLTQHGSYNCPRHWRRLRHCQCPQHRLCMQHRRTAPQSTTRCR